MTGAEPLEAITVAVLDPDADSYLDGLSARFPQVRFIADRNPADPGDALSEADVLITFGIGVPNDLLARAPRLRWVQALSTGTDQFLPLLGQAGRELLLTSTRGIHGSSVSELALLLMLALVRDLPRMLRDQGAREWRRIPGSLLCGKTAGVAGTGVIGTQILRKCRSFGMSTVAFGSARRDLREADRFHSYDRLPQVAGELDFLILVAPLTERTQGLVSRRVLEAMKPTAFLVNVGRGATVDEDALIDALREERIAGAALDTVRSEPLSAASPLWAFPNVIITPHAAGNVDSYVSDVCDLIAGNIAAFLAGDIEAMANVIRSSPASPALQKQGSEA